MFGNWLNGIDKKTKSQICVGVCALLWAKWNCRNDLIFKRGEGDFFLQVIHKATYWIHMWSYLLPEDQREPMESECTRLMAVVRAIFSQVGWQHTNRIQYA
jgi:two-component response regulator (ARR-B family)